MTPNAAPVSPLDGASDKRRAGRSRWDTPAAEEAMAEWLEPQKRSAICPMCATTFTQRHLSERFMEMARSKPAFPIGTAHAIDRVIPDGWVPLHCPPCERKALNYPDRPAIRVTAKIDERYLEGERLAMQDAS